MCEFCEPGKVDRRIVTVTFTEVPWSRSCAEPSWPELLRATMGTGSPAGPHAAAARQRRRGARTRRPISLEGAGGRLCHHERLAPRWRNLARVHGGLTSAVLHC